MGKPDYFELRKMDPEGADQSVPAWLEPLLLNTEERVLDIGCGMGTVLKFLRDKGYRSSAGVDVDKKAVSHCQAAGLDVLLISDLQEYMGSNEIKFDLVLLIQVLEHLEKKEIVPALQAIRAGMSPGGRIIVSVPNAQSATGSYWAYEDFTHSTIFTSGSLYHVLSAAGFSEVQLIDPMGLAGLSWSKTVLRRLLVPVYGFVRTLINRVTASSWHGPSADVYTFEVKAVAYNR